MKIVKTIERWFPRLAKRIELSKCKHCGNERVSIKEAKREVKAE